MKFNTDNRRTIVRIVFSKHKWNEGISYTVNSSFKFITISIFSFYIKTNIVQ